MEKWQSRQLIADIHICMNVVAIASANSLFGFRVPNSHAADARR